MQIEVRSVNKRYGNLIAVDNASFGVAEGQLLVILGPSGCGKTTLLRLVSGLESVDSGSIRIAGEEVTHLPPDRRNISMVFQSYALFPHLSVRENIIFGLKVRRVRRDEIERRLTRVIDLLGLANRLDSKPGELSGGNAAAGCPGPGHHRRKTGDADGRTPLESRCKAAQFHAQGNLFAATTAGHQHGLCHPRSGRGHDHGGSHRTDARGPHHPGRRTREFLRTACQHLRRPVHRHTAYEHHAFVRHCRRCRSPTLRAGFVSRRPGQPLQTGHPARECPLVDKGHPAVVTGHEYLGSDTFISCEIDGKEIVLRTRGMHTIQRARKCS